MKTILFTISLLVVSSALFAGTFDDSKVIRKSMPATDDFELEIKNKHGRIDVTTWDKDSVVLEITISATSNKLDRLESIMEQVTVNFSEHDDYLAASTQWGGGANELRLDFIKLFDDQTVRVDYRIWMPVETELELENKFGDISMEDCKGKLKVDLSHGDFKARKLKDAKSINVQYGDINIKELEDGNITSKFGDVTIDKAKELDLDIISGDAELEKVDELTLKATSADVEIEEVNTLNFSSTLGDIEVEKLNKTVTGYLKFGGFEIEEVDPGFMGITLNGTNTDISIDFNPQIAFVYNVQLEKGKAFSIPSEGNTLDKDNSFDDVHQYEGTFATIPVGGLPASVTISAKSSYVKFGLE
ncbi:DUF4097 domain-containing protein [Parvicella tangerina]|nr:DUF4097 domain-containing protein [Parvicella tangerina]